jgi:hypothetical protein
MSMTAWMDSGAIDLGSTFQMGVCRLSLGLLSRPGLKYRRPEGRPYLCHRSVS